MKKNCVDNIIRMFLARNTIKWENPIISGELNSYFENPEACSFFGKKGLRFSDERELRNFLSKGKLVYLSDDTINKIENFASSTKELEERLNDQTYSQSYKELEHKIEQGDLLLEAPIIVKFKDGSYWGLSGRKRAYVARRNGIPVQYFLVDQENVENEENKVEEAKKKQERREEELDDSL